MKVYAVVTNASTDCMHWITESIWSSQEAAERECRERETVTYLYEVREFEVQGIAFTRPTRKDEP